MGPIVLAEEKRGGCVLQYASCHCRRLSSKNGTVRSFIDGETGASTLDFDPGARPRPSGGERRASLAEGGDESQLAEFCPAALEVAEQALPTMLNAAAAHRRVTSGVVRFGRRTPVRISEVNQRLQAYFPKKPGNFGQHFLETCHGNRPRSGVDLHQYHMERAPHQFFSQKNVGVAKSTFSLRKSHFFSGGKTLISLRAQRAFLENFGGLVVQRDAISHSDLAPQKKLRALCQRNSTELKRFRLVTRRQSDRMTDFSRFSKNYLENH